MLNEDGPRAVAANKTMQAHFRECPHAADAHGRSCCSTGGDLYIKYLATLEEENGYARGECFRRVKAHDRGESL